MVVIILLQRQSRVSKCVLMQMITLLTVLWKPQGLYVLLNKIVLLNYLTQRSTYVGIVAIVTAMGISIRPELADAIMACALGIFGLIAVIVNDKPEASKEADKK